MKMGVPFAMIGAIIGEFIASNQGLTWLILYSSSNFDASGLFFFSSRRRHTIWTGDWSSDVCSSDLVPAVHHRAFHHDPGCRHAASGTTGNIIRRSPAGAGILQEAWLWFGTHSRDDLLEFLDEASRAAVVRAHLARELVAAWAESFPSLQVRPETLTGLLR